MGRRRARSKREGNGSKRRKTSASNSKDVKGKLTEGKISKPEAAASNEGGSVHPLLIDHILEIIFQHIISPKTDEKDKGSAESSASVTKNVHNFRLVCKQWKETATRLYRRNRAPMMSFGMMRYGLGNYKAPDEKMQNFLDVMKKSDLIPIQRYAIRDKFFVMENQQLMKDFMRICGPHAVELSFSWDTSIKIIFSRRSFPDLNLMSLKKLTLECDSGDDTPAARAPNELVGLIEALLSAAETLQEFKFFAYSCLGQKWSQAMIKRSGECISKRIPKTVKRLTLFMSFNDLHLITLAESGLKLEELEFYVHCGASSMAIRKFFESQAATLKVLKIDGGINEGGSPVSSVSLDFCRFHALLHLELEDVTIQKFSWPDTFPRLTSLNIAKFEAESTYVELLNSANKGLSLKEIHLSGHFRQALLVKKAAQCFPNINKLHISPSEDLSETLQEVFVYFPNVEELYISVWFLDNELDVDSVFSGVLEQDCQRIKNAGNFDNVNLRDMQHQPSLLNLMKLKKLVLHGHGKRVILTDFVAHFVLLKMASLNELQIHHRHRMSTKYVGLLREKLTLKLEEYDPIFDGDSDDDDDWQIPFEDSD